MSIALNNYLKPLVPFLKKPGVSEICVNTPGVVWVEEKGHFTRHDVPELTENRLIQLAHLIAEDNNKDLSETKPLLSASLTDGERCQFVLPPACEKGHIVCAIRKPSVLNLDLNGWETLGAFNTIKHGSEKRKKTDEAIKQCYQEGRWKALIALAIEAKYNIIISGGTSTAKTSFLNACLKSIPNKERVITIEGVREVQLNLPNKVHLLANEDEESPLNATILDLLKVCLRLRPDRIFVSELRGKEAYPFLRACISGHPGSLTTLHADSIDNALEQLSFMLSEAPELQHADDDKLRRIIRSSVQMIIQMTRTEEGDRVVEDIALLGANDAFCK
jgi:type IV secretion system protein VirB11